MRMSTSQNLNALKLKGKGVEKQKSQKLIFFKLFRPRHLIDGESSFVTFSNQPATSLELGPVGGFFYL